MSTTTTARTLVNTTSQHVAPQHTLDWSKLRALPGVATTTSGLSARSTLQNPPQLSQKQDRGASERAHVRLQMRCIPRRGIHDRNLPRAVRQQRAHVRGHLRGELPRGHQHQRPCVRRAARGLRAEDLLHERDAVRGRLPAAGPRAREDVPPLERERDGRGLHGRRAGKPKVGERAQEPRVDGVREGGEGVVGVGHERRILCAYVLDLLPPLMLRARLACRVLVRGHDASQRYLKWSLGRAAGYGTVAASELEDVDVAIVGGGPAGLALACALCPSCSVLHVVGRDITTASSLFTERARKPPYRARRRG